jgi:hypothetical protein
VHQLENGHVLALDGKPVSTESLAFTCPIAKFLGDVPTHAHECHRSAMALRLLSTVSNRHSHHFALSVRLFGGIMSEMAILQQLSNAI